MKLLSKHIRILVFPFTSRTMALHTVGCVHQKPQASKIRFYEGNSFMKIAQLSLKIRNAILFSALIAVILLLNAVLVIYLKYRQFENDVEQRAVTFANLAVKPICDEFKAYHNTDYFKFRELLNALMSSQPDLTRVRILNLEGSILFDSNDLLNASHAPKPNTVYLVTQDPHFLNAIQRLDMTQRKIEDEQGDENLEIVSPYEEEKGRHDLSVIMNFSYQALYPQIKLMIYQVGGLTLLSLFFTSLLSWIVTSKITQPLDHLTEKAKSMIGGVSRKRNRRFRKRNTAFNEYFQSNDFENQGNDQGVGRKQLETGGFERGFKRTRPAEIRLACERIPRTAHSPYLH